MVNEKFTSNRQDYIEKDKAAISFSFVKLGCGLI